MKQEHKSVALLLALSLALSACGNKTPGNAPNAAAAVKVNGQAISDAEFQLKGGMHAGMGDGRRPISEQTMQSMLNLELLRQAAIKDKLDAEENVRAKLATSMRSILATAYLEKVFAGVPNPSPSDIEAYYKQHPERFAERKQLAMKEVVVGPGKIAEADLRKALGQHARAADFEKWLLANHIDFNSNPVSNTTDQIPEDALKQLKDLPVGGGAILGSHDGYHVIFILDAQAQPLSLEQASPMIAGQLLENRKKEAMDKAIKSLHDSAKIEFVAPYTDKGLTLGAKD